MPEDSGIDDGSQHSWPLARLTCTLPSQVRWRPVGPRGYQGSCPGGSSDAVDVIDPADKEQMTSSDETSRQMYPLTRSSGMLCVACCYAHELDSQQYGTLTVFLNVHCSPLDQHLVQFGT